ncbi:MAG: thiamine-phosphate kinase, partial [Pseudomonadota bacterium]
MGATSDEFQLISSFLAGMDRGAAVRLGVGDDAAILALAPFEELVVSSDCAVAGVHFPTGADPQLAAFRAVAAAVSDLAAMGARPLAMTLTLAAPDSSDTLFAALQRGLEEASACFSLPLVGGDLVRAPLSLGVQVLGAVPRGEAIRRSGASPGERLCVSGTLGDAAAGLALLEGELVDLPEALQAELLERFW